MDIPDGYSCIIALSQAITSSFFLYVTYRRLRPLKNPHPQQQVESAPSGHLTAMATQSTISSVSPWTSPGLRGPVYSAWSRLYADYGRPTRGFHNTGNYCYRNVVLMLFLHSPILLNWLQHYVLSHSCALSDCLVCTLYRLSNSYWIDATNRQYHASMNRFWKCVCDPKYQPDHWDKAPGRQEDARELMETIMSLLMKDTQSPHINDFQALFTIEVSQDLICSVCQQLDSIPTDGGKFLVVDLPSRAGSITIEEAVKLSMRSKIPRHCNTCNMQTVQIVQKSILIPPEMLFIQVNRYTPQGKLQNELEVREELIFPDALIHDIAKTNEGLRYELYGVIFHKGSVKSFGHYTATVKTPSGDWALVNDEQVMFPLTLAQSMNSPDGGEMDAYILAYRRLPLQGSPGKFIVTQNEADTNTGSSEAASISMPKSSNPDRTRSLSGSPKLSDPEKGSLDGNVTLEETIQLDGRDIGWTIKQRLDLSADAGGLVKLKPRAKIQRASLKLILISEETGEILDGNANISLKPRKTRKKKTASTALMNTKNSNPGTTQTANNHVSGETAKPQGVQKRTTGGKKLSPSKQPPSRRSARRVKEVPE